LRNAESSEMRNAEWGMRNQHKCGMWNESNAGKLECDEAGMLESRERQKPGWSQLSRMLVLQPSSLLACQLSSGAKTR